MRKREKGTAPIFRGRENRYNKYKTNNRFFKGSLPVVQLGGE
ncbi:hypothetical protein B4135_1245 [Caldibacillus debilis]|uniref:Uncharacterized protein n=1 Tax=Caldibacillus debilis TaxID=301148 RepID=A0A150MDR4_9BACI|nr:hypothetical protein B4135_1245 [Caldibacillus debilis]